MLKIPLEEIINKIKENSGLSEDEIKERIQNKISSLNYLVSEEGAAFIIASELGISLLNPPSQNKTWKIADLVPGMGLVNVDGYVKKTFKVISYTRNNLPKEMGSFILADESGEIRAVLWDEKVNFLKEEKLKGAIRIKNAEVKLNNAGFKELHLNSKSSIIFTNPNFQAKKEQKLSDVKPYEQIEVIADIVHIFPTKWYSVCKICNKKVLPAPEGFICPVHKVVESEKKFLLSFYLDDGFGVVRTLAFGKNAENILKKININPEVDFELLQKELLGKTALFRGIIRQNKINNRMEFVVHEFENLEPKDIICLMQNG